MPEYADAAKYLQRLVESLILASAYQVELDNYGKDFCSKHGEKVFMCETERDLQTHLSVVEQLLGEESQHLIDKAIR